MGRLFAMIAALTALFAGAAPASEVVQLGYGRLVTNDLLGDTRDRWQTGNVASSRVYGRDWTGTLPTSPGDLIELRFNGGIMAPTNIETPFQVDRPFVGYLSFGVHTHFVQGAYDVAIGSDLVLTGPMTGLDDLQTALHDLMGIYTLSDEVRANQIQNGVHLGMTAEVGRDFALGDHLAFRPYGELRVGPENMMRAGADLVLGQVGRSELLVREPVTGQRYRAITSDTPGVSMVLGGDIAYVDSSIFLPQDRGLELTDSRSRFRAGLHWQGENGSAFYGLTYLSEEFEDQFEGQVVGSIRVQLEF